MIPELRLIIEHDGWHHERSAEQRQKDHLRRERIEAAGWAIIVITTADFLHPTAIVARVYEALTAQELSQWAVLARRSVCVHKHTLTIHGVDVKN